MILHRFAIIMIVILCDPFSVLAWAFDGHVAVESAQDSLSHSNRFPWYDKQTNQLKPLPAPEVGKLASAPQWTAKQKQPPNPPTNGIGETFLRLVQQLVWVAILFVVVALLYIWLRDLNHRQLGSLKSTDLSKRSESELIEQLPFQVRRPQRDLLAEARRHYENGNYAEAIIYLFSYQLVQLDQHHRIELKKGKTNWQYLAELRRWPTLRGIVMTTTLAFEDVFFGHHPISQTEFERCWNRLADFESSLQQS